MSCPTPAAIRHSGEFVTIERAWPTSKSTDDGARRLTVEGRDGQGRVRAAELRLRADLTRGWRVAGLALAAYGRDRKLPDLAEAARDGEVVVHRYGRRAVVRHPDRFVKVLRAGRADEVVAQSERGRVAARSAGFEAPAVISVRNDRVDFSVVAGTGLHELGGRTDLATWSHWWAQWAARWPDLVQGEGVGLVAHTAEDEQVNLRRWTDRVRLFGAPPDPLGAFTDRVTAACLALGDGLGCRLVVSHRDLHDKQILAGDAGLGLLDFDTAALAEPALDLANLLVHAQLRADQGLWPEPHCGTAVRAVLGVADVLGVPVDRLEAYAEATRLRLACLYAFRPRHRALAATWAAGHAVVPSPSR